MARIIHFQIAVDNPQNYMDFYRKQFGWKFCKVTDAGYSDFWLINTQGSEACGEAEADGILLQADQTDAGTGSGGFYTKGVTNYIDVKDIDATIAEVEKSGGHLIHEKRAIPNFGYVALLEGPGGHKMGLLEYDKDAHFSDKSVGEWG